MYKLKKKNALFRFILSGVLFLNRAAIFYILFFMHALANTFETIVFERALLRSSSTQNEKIKKINENWQHTAENRRKSACNGVSCGHL